MRNRVFARARFGRAVWNFVTWVEPLLAGRCGGTSSPLPEARALAAYSASGDDAAAARVRSAPGVPFGVGHARAAVLVDPSLAGVITEILGKVGQASRLLRSAHMSFVAELTVGAVEIVSAGGGSRAHRDAVVVLEELLSPLEYAFALVDCAAAEWMRLATWADEIRLREQGRWRRARPEDVALAAEAFCRALEFELASSPAVLALDPDEAARCATRSRMALEAAARPLENLTKAHPPLPLTKDFAVSMYPLWDALPFQWRDSHKTHLVQTRLRSAAFELRLDGVLT